MPKFVPEQTSFDDNGIIDLAVLYDFLKALTLTYKLN